MGFRGGAGVANPLRVISGIASARLEAHDYGDGDAQTTLELLSGGAGRVTADVHADRAYIEAAGAGGTALIDLGDADTQLSLQGILGQTVNLTFFANATDFQMYLVYNDGGTDGGAFTINKHVGDDVKIGFFEGAVNGGATKQTVVGSVGGNAALASLVAALTAHGLITDATT